MSARAASAHVVAVEACVPLPDGRVAVVMPHLLGGALDALVRARGHLSPGEVVTVLAPVASALGRLHDLGVVHGDVSPGNVLLDLDGRPLLADLGLGHVVGDVSPGVWGTDGYVAPEVLLGADPGPASDVYALGAAGLAVPDGHRARVRPGLRPELSEVCLAGEGSEPVVSCAGRGRVVPSRRDRPGAHELAWLLFAAAEPEPLRLVHGDDEVSAVTYRLRAAAGRPPSATRGAAPVVARPHACAWWPAVVATGRACPAAGRRDRASTRRPGDGAVGSARQWSRAPGTGSGRPVAPAVSGAVGASATSRVRLPRVATAAALSALLCLVLLSLVVLGTARARARRRHRPGPTGPRRRIGRRRRARAPLRRRSSATLLHRHAPRLDAHPRAPAAPDRRRHRPALDARAPRTRRERAAHACSPTRGPRRGARRPRRCCTPPTRRVRRWRPGMPPTWPRSSEPGCATPVFATRSPTSASSRRPPTAPCCRARVDAGAYTRHRRHRLDAETRRGRASRCSSTWCAPTSAGGWPTCGPRHDAWTREPCEAAAAPAGRGQPREPASEAKRLSPSRSARYLVTSWPRTLLPAASRGGEKVASPPLPGDTVTMPPLTPLLPGIPIS